MAALIVKNTFGLLLCMAFLNVVASQQLREKLGERNLYAEAPRQSYMQSSQQGIVGGSVADKGEYPFYAAFKPLICGGS